MLSEIHRATVASTVPLLEQGGEALITHFYKKMLADHPEVRPYFNAAHQANGDQPRALANGVLMYARHIERLEALGPWPPRSSTSTWRCRSSRNTTRSLATA